MKLLPASSGSDSPAGAGTLRAMRHAHFESDELREYVAARGGTLRVSLQAIMHG